MQQNKNFSKNRYEELNAWALKNFEEIITDLHLDGEYRGKQYVAYNPMRDDSSLGSFTINTENGVWCDFADSNAKGGDLVSLVAYLKNLSQPQAYEYLLKVLNEPEAAKTINAVVDTRNVGFSNTNNRNKGNEQSKWLANLPVSQDAPLPPLKHPQFGTPSLSWTYLNENGELLCRIDRYDLGDNKKEFRPLTYCTNSQSQLSEWRWQGFPEPRPLYGLQLLATKPEAEIVICEGEKATDAAQQLLPNVVAMTTMNGAMSASKCDFSPLLGRKVTIWPDNDNAGSEYANEVVQQLRLVDAKMPIRIMKPLTYKATASPDGSYGLSKIDHLVKGWDAADALVEGWQAEHLAIIWPDNNYFNEVEIKEYQHPYVIAKDGVYILGEKDGKAYETKISSYLKVLAETRDAGSQNWGLLVELKDSDNNIHQWAMPRELLTSQGFQFVQTMTKLGLKIGISDKSKDQIAIYLNDYSGKARALCVTQQGWYQQSFVTAKGIVGPSKEMVVVQTTNPEDLRIFRHQGSYEDWCQYVADYCVDNSRLIFSMCTAFTSPVLYWLNEENGGFHLKGNSSIGKTVALKVAVSVWGGPDLMQRWRSTANGIEGTATRFNDTFLALDEINQIDPAEAGETAYMLGNGQGKVRATTNGSIRTSSKWRLIFLSSGEITLSDHLVSSGKKVMAGQEVRMVNIPADAGSNKGIFNNLHDIETPTLFAERLVSNASTHFGTAGPLWIAVLADAEKRGGILGIIKKVKTNFINTYVATGSSGQVFRVAGRFALIAGVGEACISAGVLPWEAGSAISAIKECFLSWLDLRGGNGNYEAEAALLQVRRFIETHAESRFTAWNEMSDEDGLDATTRTINRVGFRRVKDDGSIHYYILPESFKREVCQGLDPREVAKLLLERGYLITGNDGKAQSSHRLPGIKNSTRVYCISSEILNDTQPEALTEAAAEVENVTLPA